jgi:adenine phosphoribosyltransferase
MASMERELRGRLRTAFRWVDPGPGSTHLVSDRSGWWRDAVLLDRVGPALAALHPGARPTVVVSPEVTGFILGPLVARALGVGFVGAYRADRARSIPEAMTWAEAPDDHRGERPCLGVADRHLSTGDRVLLVDDWLTTGAQLRAVAAAVTARGAHVVGTAVIVDEAPPVVAAELLIRGLISGDDL